MTDHSETGPMTASEDEALEAARRATRAQHPWWLSQDAQGTPVYFVREPSDMGAWREATQEAFEYFPEKYRRVLYTHPAAQPVQVQAPDLYERIAAAHDASLDDDHRACRVILGEIMSQLAAAPLPPAAPGGTVES